MSKGFDNPRRTDIDVSYEKERIISSIITDVIPSSQTDGNDTLSSTGNNDNLSNTNNKSTLSNTNNSERNVRKYNEGGILNNDKVNKFLNMFVGLPLYSVIILGIVVYIVRSRKR
jgi:hypothetical protein